MFINIKSGGERGYWFCWCRIALINRLRDLCKVGGACHVSSAALQDQGTISEDGWTHVCFASRNATSQNLASGILILDGAGAYSKTQSDGIGYSDSHMFSFLLAQ